MKEIKAKLRYSRISPRKTRLLVDVVRGLPVVKAESQLKFRRLKATPIVLKLLKSAIANAEHNEKLKKSNLYIKKISVDGGPVLKRFTPKAFGRAGSIRKPTSHIEIVLAEIKPSEDKKETRDLPAPTEVASHRIGRHGKKAKETSKKDIVKKQSTMNNKTKKITSNKERKSIDTKKTKQKK